MELIIGFISFAGELIAAWAMSMYGYFQDKFSNN